MTKIPVGFEVNTRSGELPSTPYVKQEDGTWKPKYVSGRPTSPTTPPTDWVDTWVTITPEAT